MRKKAVEICAIFLTGLIMITILLHFIIYLANLRRNNVILGARHHKKVFCSERRKSFVTCFLLVSSLTFLWLPFTIFYSVLFSSFEPNLEPRISVYFECYVIEFLSLLNLFFNSFIHTLHKIKFRRLTGSFSRVTNHHLNCDRRFFCHRDTTNLYQNRLCHPSFNPNECTSLTLGSRRKYRIVDCRNDDGRNEMEMPVFHYYCAPNNGVYNNSDAGETIREKCV